MLGGSVEFFDTFDRESPTAAEDRERRVKLIVRTDSIIAEVAPVPAHPTIAFHISDNRCAETGTAARISGAF